MSQKLNLCNLLLCKSVSNPYHKLTILGFEYRIKALKANEHAITIIVYQEFNNDAKLKEKIGEVI